MSSRPVTLAIVGATGLAGRAALELLPDSDLDPSEVRLLASERSREERLELDGEEVPVRQLTAGALDGVDIALFFVRPPLAREWAPRARAAGCVVVDASSAFRADPSVPLVAPGLNPQAVAAYEAGGLVAIPGGPAATLAPALAALAKAGGVAEVHATVLAPAAAAGTAAVVQLEAEAGDLMNGREPDPGVAVPHRLAYNLVPQVGEFLPDGRTDEEAGLEGELRRILGLPGLAASATAIRVPVFYGLAVAARVVLERPLSQEAARAALRGGAGLKLVDEPGAGVYPMPMLSMNDDAVLAGRVRADEARRAVELLATSDDLRHGVLSALRVAELLVERF